MATISASPGSVAGSLRGPLTPPVGPSSWRRSTLDSPARAIEVVLPDDGEARAAKRLLAGGLVVFLLALVLSGLMAGAASRVAASLPSEAVPPEVVESVALPAWTVSAGDTLWTIAQATDPESDPRDTVVRLRVVNRLPADHVLQVGEVLQLPSR